MLLKYFQPQKILYKELVNRLKEPSSPLLLLDVRFPTKFSKGSIPTAHNIQADKLFSAITQTTPQEWQQIFSFPKPKKDDEIVLFCQYGIKARQAADQLAVNCGYTKLRVYEGSMAEWNLLQQSEAAKEKAE
jgi:3-mercaptopyruvate sulfurtransferase SseA